MQCWRLIFLLVLLAGGVTAPASSLAADTAKVAKADRVALRTALKQLQSPVSGQRAEALRQLRQLPGLEGARMIVPTRLNDPAPEVQRAAYETLLTWKDEPEVASFLLKTLEKEARGKKNGPGAAVPLVGVLLASDLPDTQEGLTKLLDTHVTAGNDSISVMIALADELGAVGDEQAVESLRAIARLKFFSESFACRRAVIQALTRIRLPKAVAALIELLGDIDGEARGDILRHLAAVSGKQLGTDGRAWAAWWKKKGEDFAFPVASLGNLAAEVAPRGVPSYYGLSLQAKRIVFVVDISGSMAGRRLLAVKRELTSAIQGLPEDASFGIVVFNDHVLTWRAGLATASPAGKELARQFIYSLRAGGHTASYDALEAAFRFDAEAIYFLSDGDPNVGKIIAPPAIVAAISKINRQRRMTIYTVGIAPGMRGGPLDTFMRMLAEQNFGMYRWIDQ